MTGIGIIGAGGVAGAHLRAISQHRPAKALCLADIQLRTARRLAHPYDFIVVGGGVYGAAAALELAQTKLDRRAASEATAAQPAEGDARELARTSSPKSPCVEPWRRANGFFAPVPGTTCVLRWDT